MNAFKAHSMKDVDHISTTDQKSRTSRESHPIQDGPRSTPIPLLSKDKVLIHKD
ncbi:hypothetical protein SynSYN20_01369 [Synechococcus sp. SYN20]|nr:hypothetical protein SynSYN20_01369 [Synechococcus sp. SYN20]